ncbi:MAG: transporter substrate-binding domain-containing protein [Geminicoccaceae bacterium]
MKNSLKAAMVTVGIALAATAASAESVKIGIGAEPYPPFTSPDASGNWEGWEIDFANAVCAEAKFECEITPVAWDGIIPALTSNKIDAIIGSMSITEERLKTIDFSDKYYNTPANVVTAKGSGITPDAEGLAGKILAVQVSTTHQAYATKYFGDAEIKEYQTQDEANQDLVAGRVDATLADALALDVFLQSADGGCCEATGAVVHDEAVFGPGVGIGLRKGDERKETFNAAIAAVRENGTYDELTKKYFDLDIYGE